MFPNQGAQSAPPPPPPPPPQQQATPPPPQQSASSAAPSLWVHTPQGVVKLTANQYQAMDPNTPAMSEDQSSGWQTIGALAPIQHATQSPATQQAGWGQGTQQTAPPATQQNGWGGGGGGSAHSAHSAHSNPYAGIEKAEIGDARNPYLSQNGEGDYALQIVASYFIMGRSKNAQIIEVDVLAAQGEMDQNGNPLYTKEGTRATIYIGKNDAFDANCKRIVIAASGFDEHGNPRPRDDVVTPQEAAAVLNGDNPGCVGALMYVEARRAVSNGGNTYTRYECFPLKSKGIDQATGKPIPDLTSVAR